LKDKNSIFIDEKASIGDNVIIYENNRIEGNSVIGDNVTIYPGSFISNSIIGKGTKIYSSFIEKSVVGACSLVGPYAHLRSGSKLGDCVKLGNFCEVKNAEIGSHTKISHLSFVGDAKIGENCKIGSGVVFLGVGEKTKKRIIVQNNVVFGSNISVVAPILIESGAVVASGQVIDHDVLSH
jgi:bifunctional UDP-N-acetylglucosamine pyrophosphorylase/glucosamine-1-phosphate N-acetyltransferase